MTVDLEPAARRMADLVTGVPDDLLERSTPCPAYTLGDLLDHVSALALAFTDAATKTTPASITERPVPDAARLGDDWRTRIPHDLTTLADAWRDPAAWTGMTRAGGIDMPGEIAGFVALDELVLHGWDLARTSGQDFSCDRQSLEAVHRFIAELSGPGQEAMREGIFGPVVDVPDDAPLLERVVGLAGRDPAWSPES